MIRIHQRYSAIFIALLITLTTTVTLARQNPRMKHAMQQIPRIETKKTYSPPPSLMGKQMGVVNTLNVEPLGYKMDGNVKVFTLIAQPINHVFTDGKAVNEHIIPTMYRYVGRTH